MGEAGARPPVWRGRRWTAAGSGRAERAADGYGPSTTGPPCRRWRSRSGSADAGPSSTAAERRAAQVVLERPQLVGFGTVADLAEAAGAGPRPSCDWPPSSASTASARSRRRSRTTSPGSCARRPSGSASSAATSRSSGTGRPSCPTCRRRSTPSIRSRSMPSSAAGRPRPRRARAGRRRRAGRG